MEKLYDLVMSGAGTQGGGKYKDVKISGAGVIQGEIEAETISVSGVGTFEENVKAREIRISGSGNFHHNVETESITINGAGKVEGDVVAGNFTTNGSSTVRGSSKTTELKVRGTARFEQKVEAEKIETRGVLKVYGGVEAETFCSHGVFDIRGLLNAHYVEIKLEARAVAEEIGGERIEIKLGGPFRTYRIWEWLGFTFPRQRCEAKLIEGTTVLCEHTIADVVRGEHVVIGPKCKIKRVEYTGTLEVDPKAYVGEQVRL